MTHPFGKGGDPLGPPHKPATSIATAYADEVRTRLAAIAATAAAGGLDAAIDLLATAVANGAVIQAFGTGHSEAFAMEIAGRAGGLIPTNKIALRDVVVRGSRPLDVGASALERDPSVVDELWALSPINKGDVFVIASNSGVNGSVVGLALLAKEHGHPLIAVTSLEHTRQVEPKHSSGKRLADIADVVLDNLAPYGDATLDMRAEPVEAPATGPSTGSGRNPTGSGRDPTGSGRDPTGSGRDPTGSGRDPTGSGRNPTGSGRDSTGSGRIKVGAVSSITSAFLAQLLTLGVAERLSAGGGVPPLYLSANIPGGDAHNHALEEQYAGRIRRGP